MIIRDLFPCIDIHVLCTCEKYVLFHEFFGCVFHINVEYSVYITFWHLSFSPHIRDVWWRGFGLVIREGFKGCSMRWAQWDQLYGCCLLCLSWMERNSSECDWACHQSWGLRKRSWASHTSEMTGRSCASYPDWHFIFIGSKALATPSEAVHALVTEANLS